MEKFELNPSEYPLQKRIQKEVSLLAILLGILLFFVGIHVVYLTSTLLMYVLLLLLKRNRIVTKITFSDTSEKVTIFYFYLIFFRGKETINYNKLSFKLGLKRFGFGSAIETMELFKGKILAGELRKKGKWKWSEECISQLEQKLNSIK
ncbi:hypothetical protein [Labilibaculum sp.]|uniref:hypothetical protein n=1 Tax=Labilibaculum sp. TaxID=2060723 RepID=UPI003567839B